MNRDLLAASPLRPWHVGALHQAYDTRGSELPATDADVDLIVAAVNEYEALLDIVEIVAERRARFRDGSHDHLHPRNAEELRLDAALDRLDAIRGES